ncbi:hypothetical protein HGA34_01695 [Candidatus Falkowbacteria bacterium]|nr:hypothetical protein [Candidatus Falkowbacteria bacterium]
MQKKNKVIILSVIGSILLLTVILVFVQSRTFKRLAPLLIGGRVIEEELTIPELKSATDVDGRLMSSSRFLTPLVPKSARDRVIVPLADLTLKQGLAVARLNAGYWSDDAKLMYAKSSGAVTLEGKSSQWLYVFGSEKKRAALGVVVRGKEVVANLELAADNYGHDLPGDWLDVSEAIASLANTPGLSDRSIGGLALYHNEDSKKWSFGIALDKGQSTSVPLE